MLFNQVIVYGGLVVLFVAHVTPVSVADRALDMVAAKSLYGRRLTTRAFGHVGAGFHFSSALFANKIACAAKRHLIAYTAFDRANFAYLRTSLAPSVVDGGIHALNDILQMLLMQQTLSWFVVHPENLFLGNGFAKGTDKMRR